MSILCPLLLFFAGVPCWVIGNKRLSSFGDCSVFSVPLCPTSDPLLYVGAPAIGTCSLDVDPVTFTSSLSSRNRIWIAHNVANYTLSVVIYNSQETFVHVTYDKVSEGPAAPFPSATSRVFCPIRPTLVTEREKLEPACAAPTGVVATVDGEFAWADVGEVDFGKNAEVTVDLGRVRARGRSTPAMFLVVSKVSSAVLRNIGIAIVALSLIAEVPLLVYVLAFTCCCPEAYWEWRYEEEYLYDKKWFAGQLPPEHY